MGPFARLWSNAVLSTLLSAVWMGGCGVSEGAATESTAEESPAEGMTSAESARDEVASSEGAARQGQEETGEAEREGAGPPPAAWVQRRVAEAAQRLAATEGGRILAEAIEAHGGLSAWLGAGNLSFVFDYRPLNNPERRMHTFQQIDLWSARAVHQEREGGAGERAHFGWDGEAAWIEPSAEAFPVPARFWALTPYYFVGIPFVLADPGAQFERLPDATLDGAVHQLVKVTYDAGTGDSPDDYYIVYVHAETHRVAALRYIVSYPGFFEAGQHSPEKLMRYSDYQTTEGLLLAHRYDTYAWEAEGSVVGDRVTENQVSELAARQPMSDGIFAAPAGAMAVPLADAE